MFDQISYQSHKQVSKQMDRPDYASSRNRCKIDPLRRRVAIKTGRKGSRYIYAMAASRFHSASMVADSHSMKSSLDVILALQRHL